MSPVINSFVTLLCYRWIDELRGLFIVFVSQTQLEGGLKCIHATSAGSQTRTSQTIYFSRLGTIVTMNCRESCPQCEIDMICALNVHRYTHCRGVRYIRMRGMVGGHDDAGADRLFSEEIVQYLLLYPIHHVTAEKADHRQVHAGVHQTERVAGGNDAIERWQILETPTDNLNFRM